MKKVYESLEPLLCQEILFGESVGHVIDLGSAFLIRNLKYSPTNSPSFRTAVLASIKYDPRSMELNACITIKKITDIKVIDTMVSTRVNAGA